MPGLRSFAVLAASAIIGSVGALPQNYGHGGPPYGNPQATSTPSLSAASSTTSTSAAAPTTYPTLSVSSSATPYPYSASGSASAATGVYPSGASGSVYPTASGAAYPTGASPPSSNSTANSTSALNASMPNAMRGVNIGGWLILEKWMNADMFADNDAVDQWTFDQTSGAAAALQAHWSSFFTEADVAKISSWGINALRIPIGYWAYNNTGTPYITGADAYLEQAIGWARQYGMKVMVDCHGSPGSQNGQEHSGREGGILWQDDDNLSLSISILETMAEKYGSMEYADTVYAIELVNEPKLDWNTNFTSTQQWAQTAYQAVKAKATNPDLKVIMHDGFMGASNWETVGSAVNGEGSYANSKFAMDVHLYQNQDSADNALDNDQHISQACGWVESQFLPASSNLPVYVGEFSAGTNICANPDYSTVGGSVCTTSGCQCSVNVPIQSWQDPLKQATRKFFEAEMETFEYASAGWFLWTYRDPTGGAWALENLMEYVYDAGEKVTDRKYPNQCNFTGSALH